MIRALVGCLLAWSALTGCSGYAGTPAAGPTTPSAAAVPLPSASESASGSSSASTLRAPPPRPARRACYLLSFDQALSPVTRVAARPCDRAHTARTVHVGSVGDLVEGRVGSIDSPRVQRAVAQECPRRFASFLGGPEQARRLSMFRPIWFTPTLAEAEQGQDWYRCDLIALAGEGRLLPLEGKLEGLLGRLGWKPTYGLCATASPGAPAFRRVACGRDHTWRALMTVPFTARDYPGTAIVRARGDEPCTAVARAVAPDPLDFQWGFEWPTAEQWADGIRWGVCWAPEA
ncbi:MAG: septum formation family protein [Nocardioides sp.]